MNNLNDKLILACNRKLQKNYKIDKTVEIKYYELNSVHKKLLHNRFNFLKECNSIKQNPDIGIIWGNINHKENNAVIDYCLKNDKPILMAEDAFLRSADTWANKTVDKKYSESTCGFMFDTSAFYFDAYHESDLEKMLNDHTLVLTDEQILEARQLIKKIVDNKLTKYNHQPIFNPEIGTAGKKKILLIDQSYGDASVANGMGNENTFKIMLDTALAEGPDYEIIIKTHPDTLAGKRKCYYSDVYDNPRIIKIDYPINPYSLIQAVDKVYVCTTQFGFEALMAGKETHTFGVPFYSNWGLTVDHQKLERRNNIRTLEEVFYITYCIYTKWINQITKKPCTIHEVIDYLISIRHDYFKQYNIHAPKKKAFVWAVDLDLNSNIMCLESICSAIKNSSCVSYYLITQKSNPFIYYFNKIAGLNILDFDQDLEDYIFLQNANNSSSKLSNMVYARFLIMKNEIFKSYDSIIYLDCDTIVQRNMNNNLLLYVDTITTPIAMAKEDTKSNILLKSFCKNNNLNYNTDSYGNAGVIVFKPKYINLSDFTTCIKLIQKNFRLNDQDILNYHFQNQITFFKPKYNSFAATERNFKHEEPVICHYVGTMKKDSNIIFGLNYLKHIYKKFI